MGKRGPMPKNKLPAAKPLDAPIKLTKDQERIKLLKRMSKSK